MTINKKSIVNRYFFIVVVMLLLGVFIIAKAAIIMYAERKYWQEVADRFHPPQPRQHPLGRRQADGQLAARVPHLHGLHVRRA